MARRQKIDWLKAKQEFLAVKELKLKDIAETYKISYSRLTAVAMNEKWSAEKERIWGKAEEEAIEETEGSIKDLIKRHSKVAKFLQAGALTHLSTIVKHYKDHPDELTRGKLGEISRMIQALTGMSGEGLKAERELYPKQMQIKGDLTLQADGLSSEAEEAIYESFRAKLGRKKPSIHRVRHPKTATKKK